MAREFRTFGPPGTGKTTWLARQCEHALHKFPASDIYAVSFTRAAAIELAGRSTGIPKENIGTIHSLCYRRLHQPPIIETETEFLEEWNLRYGHMWPVAGEAPLDEWPGAGADKALMTWNRDRGLLRKDSIEANFAEAWEAFKTECGVCDFTDLLLNAPESIGAAVLLVDEVQDLTPLQWRIVRQWGETPEVFCVVGDDDQTIYEWLGARPDEFLRPLPEDHILTLSQSYRLPRAIHGYAQRWIEPINPRRRAKEFKPRDAEGSVERCGATWKEATALVEAVLERAEQGRKVMVLATCGFMMRPCIKALRRAGALYHNPYRPKRGEWNPIRPSSTLSRVASFLKLSRGLAAMDREILSRTELWRDLSQLIRVKDTMRRGAKTEIKDAPDVLEDPLLAMSKWFNPASLTAIEKRDLEWLEANLTARSARAAEYPLEIIKRRGEGMLTKVPQIVVGTIHSVKGGEADDVFLFPDISWSADEAVRIQGVPMEDAIRRQFYVGMTRARENLFLCSGAGGPQVHL